VIAVVNERTAQDVIADAKRTLDGRSEHGIYSAEAGGFIDSGLYTAPGALVALEGLVDAGQSLNDIWLWAFCADHRDDEQIDGACDYCEDEDEPECEGHPASEFGEMGVTTYCDGSCIA
jgi:hypothetical protein